MLTVLALLAALLLMPVAAMAATITWTGTYPGDGVTWEDSGNWSPQQVPGSADDVVANTGLPCINSMVSVHSLTTKVQITVQGSGGLALGTGTSTFDHSGGIGQGGIYFNNAGPMSNAGTLILLGDAGGGGNLYQAGSLANTGTIECRLGLYSVWRTMLQNHGIVRVRDGGTLDIADAQMAPGSVTSADAGSSLMGSNGTWTLADGSTVAGEVVGNGTLRVPENATATLDDASLNDGWTMAGPGTLHVPSGSTLLLDDLDYGGWFMSFLDDCTLRNDGTARFRGPVMLENNATIDNYGTFEIATNDARLDSDLRSTINNLGVFTKSGGDGISYIEPILVNHGTVSASDGVLTLVGGGTSDGHFEGTTGGTVSLGLYGDEFVVRDPAGQGGPCFTGGVDVGNATVTVPAGATATFAGQNSFSAGGVLRGPGTVEIPQGSVLYITASGYPYIRNVTVNNHGTLRCTGSAQAYLDSGATLNNSGTIELRSTASLRVNNLGAAPAIVNTGTLVKSSTADEYSSVEAPFTNQGIVRVTGGILQFGQGALTNYNASTMRLTGGAFEALESGTLSLPGSYLRSLAADILISGPEARVKTYTADDLTDLTTITSAGTLRLDEGKALTTGALTSAGTIMVGADSTLAVNAGAFTQTAGETRLMSASSGLGSDTQVKVQGGTLGGIGTVTAPLDNPGGTLAPGFDARGILSVSGSFGQPAAGTSHVDIAGSAVGSGYDRVAVGGAATLGGTLEAHTANGYTPAIGTTFQIMTYTTKSGTFDQVVALPVGSFFPAYAVTYNATNVTLTYVGADQAPPTTTVSGADDVWHADPATLTFSATDEAGGCGVAKTEYKLDAGAWATGTSLTVSAAGTHTVQYRSTDLAGNVEAEKSCTVKISGAGTDVTPPTTTASGADDAWHTAPVTLTFAATDDAGGSGVAKTEYKLDAGAWATGASLTVSAAGSHTVQYRSTDLAGNVEAAKTCTVKVDLAAPTTAASGADDAWHKSPVKLTFAASDETGGSGAARTEYSTDGGATWTGGTSTTVSAEGTTAVQYRSTDVAGNVEAAKNATVRIDSGMPTTKAFKASVKKGRKVRLTYQVSDALPGSGQAKVALKVYKGAKLKKTIRIKTACTCNAKQSYSWKCTLAKGKYTLKVYATDLAGNAQSKVGSAKLVVK